MNREQEFTDFLKELLSQYKKDISEKNRFLFIPYKKYETDTNSTDQFKIYEDWWQHKPEIVKSKLKSVLQISERIYARQCEIKKINKPFADKFLIENHLYGFTNSKIKYGLFYKDTLYGLAAFAGQRQFRQGRSVELLRFCTKNGYSVIGGLDKLLQAYIRNYKPDSIMTYIDSDWGTGNAFLKLGFEITDNKLPMTFFVDTQTGARIPEKYFSDFQHSEHYVKIKNSGSLKMIKPIKNK